MLYKIQWLVALPSKQTNILFLLDAADDKTAKLICSKYSIAVFTIEPYTQTPETFGKAYIRLLYEKVTYTLYSDFDKAKDLYMLFYEAWVNITYINNLRRPLADADVVRVLEKLEQDYKILHAPTLEKDKSYVTQFTNMVIEKGGEDLVNVKQLAGKAVEESDAIMAKMSPEELKTPYWLKVKNAIEILKRVRLWSNIIKIREQISTVYQMMEKVEMQYLEEQKDNEIQVIEWSTVTYLDIVSEWDKYKKTMSLQKAKAQWGWGLNYYVVFGSLGLYQKLIGKELQSKFSSVIIVLNWIYDILIMFIMMTIIWLVLLQFFNTIAFKWSFFTFAFIDVWIMWICSAVLMKFKKPNLINLIIIGPVCVWLYFLLRAFIYANFWL
jgi:hypothetical protein